MQVDQLSMALDDIVSSFLNILLILQASLNKKKKQVKKTKKPAKTGPKPVSMGPSLVAQNKIVVSNLASSVTQRDLSDLFGKVGMKTKRSLR